MLCRLEAELLLTDMTWLMAGMETVQARGCPLRGLPTTPDCAAQIARFKAAGWKRAQALDMDTIYSTVLPAADRSR